MEAIFLKIMFSYIFILLKIFWGVKTLAFYKLLNEDRK